MQKLDYFPFKWNTKEETLKNVLFAFLNSVTINIKFITLNQARAQVGLNLCKAHVLSPIHSFGGGVNKYMLLITLYK